ncbi:hypothetical protein DID73_01805 [Candidatus Marinamargulisbacteria bacterium SCGC AG-343-K17]|nr:hypothetical protein DID73_01805 [Candidatus Marinamargulisbacteria bacterium SCGC AG-343-K17]
MQAKNINERVSFDNYLDKEMDVSSDYMSELATLLSAKKLTVSVIESMTGGGIARKLVEAPGCSNYFLGGVIAYHSRLKVQYGLVSPKTIIDHGVVSASVTEEMAAGIRKVTKSDIAIASNGIAGPKNDAYSADQSGTVFLSWNIHDKIIKTKRYNLEGGRNNVIDSSIFIALSMCLRYLKNELRKDN